jgi:hypothetical protein
VRRRCAAPARVQFPHEMVVQPDDALLDQVEHHAVRRAKAEQGFRVEMVLKSLRTP